MNFGPNEKLPKHVGAFTSEPLKKKGGPLKACQIVPFCAKTRLGTHF